jgi:2,4-dichlorophenol 6-monooxygenase
MQDADGVTTTCLRPLHRQGDSTIRSKYLLGADGGNSLVAEHAKSCPSKDRWASAGR